MGNRICLHVPQVDIGWFATRIGLRGVDHIVTHRARSRINRHYGVSLYLLAKIP
jgi:hypothetical protein